MSSRLQLDMRNLSPGKRHLVNAYEVEAGIGVIAGNTVWSMPERLECEVLQKARYINTLTFTFLLPLTMALSCINSEIKRDIGWKSLFFSYPLNSTSPLGEPHRKIGMPFGMEKLEW